MSGQDLSTHFLISTTATQSTLVPSSPSLSFKRVYINQSMSIPLTIKNTSFLPQKISFIKMKKEISVQPNDGLAILLPNESFTFSVNFCPSSVTEYFFDLILLSNFNDKIIIKVTGEGIECPLLFDKSVLTLRSTSPGERVIENIMIQNISEKRICLELLSPDSRISWLKFSPNILDLKSMQICRVEINFFPPENIKSENPIEWFQKLKNILIVEEKENLKDKEKDNEIDNKILNDQNKLILPTATKNGEKNKIANGNGINAAFTLTKSVSHLEIGENELNTTFGIFTDPEEDSGFISVKNSFGEILWVKTPELKMEENRENENSQENGLIPKMKFDNILGFENRENTILLEEDESESESSESEDEDENDKKNNLKSKNKNGNNSNNNKNNIKKNQIDIKNKLKEKLINEIDIEKEKEKIRERLIEKENELKELSADIPSNEWGISGKWSLPIHIRIFDDRNEKHENGKKNNTPLLNNTSKIIITKKNENEESNSPLPFPPLFFGIHTAVILPQIDCDTKILNFGQIAIGTKSVKTITISNLQYNSVRLVTDGTNAVGPFSVLNPLKTLDTQEFKKIVFECRPSTAGLFFEILEFRNSDEIGGHRLRISLRAHGVTPSVSLEGLLPPPMPWGTNKNGSGILDFGNVLVGDIVTNNFMITNHSSFSIDVTLIRAVCTGLSPYNQLNEITNRTLTGLPIFSYRPEGVRLQPGEILDAD